jgi:hypothetical protein
MALLGLDGMVRLFREWPAPEVISDTTLSTAGGKTRVDVEDRGWWSGDRVELYAPGGLPFDFNGDGYADCPDGHRMYGPDEVPGPATLHRTTDAGPMYRGDTEAFYEDSESVGLTPIATLYVHRDQLDRVTYYTDEFSAINGGGSGLKPLIPVGFGNMKMMAAWNETDGWRQVCNLQGFVIDIDPSNLDVAAIGEEFGSAVRGLVRGAGSFNGQMSNQYHPGTTNTARLAKLALLTRKGATAKAHFQIGPGNYSLCTPEPPLYYEVDILMGKTTVSVAVAEATTLQAEFVMTSEPRMVIDYIDEAVPPRPDRIEGELSGFVLTEPGDYTLLETWR